MELYPSAQSSSQKENFVNISKKFLENRNWTFPVVRYFTSKMEFFSNVLSVLEVTLILLYILLSVSNKNRTLTVSVGQNVTLAWEIDALDFMGDVTVCKKNYRGYLSRWTLDNKGQFSQQ